MVQGNDATKIPFRVVGGGEPRPRPALFRALGSDDPPDAIEIEGRSFRRLEVLKHDSWAATAIYRCGGDKAVCKFNRRQPVLGVPTGWLGRLLARRERRFMRRLEGVVGIPRGLGPIREGGRPLPNAVARTFVEGHALAEGERVDDRFFPRLEALLAAVHARGVAHVDLHKRENILVDLAGRPHLIDFQISVGLSCRSRWAAAVLAPLHAVLVRCDEYHLLKHRLKHRPDQLDAGGAELAEARPRWIAAHRAIAVPFRKVRRRLLTLLGIRSAGGHAESEHFPEVAHRRPTAVAGRPVRAAA
jgi:hypothetical protein